MTEVQITNKEASDCVESLWSDAFAKSPLDATYTLLRVSGLADAKWDPFEETLETFNDYNWHLKAESDELSPKSSWRIGLLMYCHAVEMSAVHTALANLLRIHQGHPYHVTPLNFLGRTPKNKIFKFFPPSAKTKWKEISDMASKARLDDLVRIIDSIYNDTVRNAFSHSDYIITDTHFRWTEGGLPGQIPLEQVSNLITNSFNFFSTFTALNDRWLNMIGKSARYYKLPKHEVLELITDDRHKLNGFRVHFSNGNSAQFIRTDEGVDCSNLWFENDGSINFNIGMLNSCEEQWKIDGKPVDFGDQAATNEL